MTRSFCTSGNETHNRLPADSGELVMCAPGATTIWSVECAPEDNWSVFLERERGSGGHDHPDGPVGSAQPASGRGPLQGIRLTAPEASGRIQVKWTFSAGVVDLDILDVKINGLVKVEAGNSIQLIGVCRHAGGCHWAHPAAKKALKLLADAFYAKFAKPLQVNDISLQWGGLFDINADWKVPHKTHRDGRSIDIRNVGLPTPQQIFIKQEAARQGFNVHSQTNPPHEHLTLTATDPLIRAWESENDSAPGDQGQ
jgi:hypothetical protein